MTPLHLAALVGSVRIVRRLLIRGADRNIKDKFNKKPMEIAKEKNF